jgi:hypothetical protein
MLRRVALVIIEGSRETYRLHHPGGKNERSKNVSSNPLQQLSTGLKLVTETEEESMCQLLGRCGDESDASFMPHTQPKSRLSFPCYRTLHFHFNIRQSVRLPKYFFLQSEILFKVNLIVYFDRDLCIPFMTRIINVT